MTSLHDWRDRETYRQCTIQFCAKECSDRYDAPFCQEHILDIWMMVERDMKRANISVDDVEADRKVERQRRERDRKAGHTGTVYYLAVAGHIKIGYTKNLHQRISQYPPNAELLATHDGTPTDERSLHGRFAAYLDSGREWFRDVPEIREHIRTVNAERGAPMLPVRRVRRRPPPVAPRSTIGRRVG